MAVDPSDKKWSGSRAEWAFGYGVVGTGLWIYLIVIGEVVGGVLFIILSLMMFGIAYYFARHDAAKL